MGEIKWIKVVTDMFDNRKIKQIETLPDGDAIIVVWMKLLCLAGNINEQGMIYFTKEIPYTEEMMATEFNRPVNTIRLALKTFKDFGMIEIIDDIICISNWEKYQNVEGMDKIREQTRLRVAKHREKKKLLLEQNDDVTLPVTLRNATEEDKKRKEKEEDKKREDKKEIINYQEIVDMYNDTCVSFPRVTVLSDARKKAIKARLNTYSLDDFKLMFEKAEDSSFLKGKNDRNWFARFDWMIKDSNMAKILDGNYDDRGGNQTQKGNKVANDLEQSYEMMRQWAQKK